MNAINQKFAGFKPKQTSDKVPAKKVADWKPGEELVAFWLEDKEFDSTMYNSKLVYHYLIKAEIDKKGNILTNDEVICLRSGAGLANQLKGLKKGQLIKLVYEGKIKNQKTGMFFHKFSSQVADNIYQPKVKVDVGLDESDEPPFEIEWED